MNISEPANPFQAPVYYKESCGSTMTEAARYSEALHGTTVYCSYQTAGRGRGRNRSWESKRGESLLFTVILKPEKTVHPVVRLPLICALALEETLKKNYGIDCSLKWPNDLLVNHKKISGILCEYRDGRVLAGIGINIKQKAFPPEIKDRATSMLLEGIRSVDKKEFLETFLVSFKNQLEAPLWKEKAESLLYGKDRILEVLEGGTENPIQKKMRILGLDDEGFLSVMDVETGVAKSIQAGEISFKGFGDFR